MNHYTFNRGMILTPYGRIWLRSLLSGVMRLSPLTLQLGQYRWESKRFERVQQPVRELPVRNGSVLLSNLNEHYTEAGLLDAAGQTLAVCPLEVACCNAEGVIEFLRWRLLLQSSSSRLDQMIPAPKFDGSVYKLGGGNVDPVPMPLELPKNPDDTFATAPAGTQRVEELFDRAPNKNNNVVDPIEMIQPDASIHTSVGFASRWGMRVRAGWKLPRTRLFLGVEPGIYLHVLKTTRLHHA